MLRWAIAAASQAAGQMNANGGGLATPTGAPVRRPPDPGWSPLAHAGEPRKVCHEAGEGSAARLPPTIVKASAPGPPVCRLFQRKLTAADFDEDYDEDFWDEADAEWACGIFNDDGGDEEQGGDMEQGPGGARISLHGEKQLCAGNAVVRLTCERFELCNCCRRAHQFFLKKGADFRVRAPDEGHPNLCG